MQFWVRLRGHNRGGDQMQRYRQFTGLRQFSHVAVACAITLYISSSALANETGDTTSSSSAQAAPTSAPLVQKTKAEVQQAKNTQAQRQQLDAATVKGVNRIPGVNVSQKEMTSVPEETPIHGFHPIKKMLRPVVELEKNSNDLEKQIMRLEGPIAGLQPHMLGLQKKMGVVENKMVNMQGSIDEMRGRVTDVAGSVTAVNRQMTGVRSDLKSMRQDISDLRKPITDLQGPLHDLQGPLSSVSQPLREVYKELADMKALLQMVLLMIALAAVLIAVGTPLAAILIYRNRRKLFPNLSDQEFPVAKADDNKADRLTRV